MGKKLYVGNLSYNTGDRDLDQLFAAHGTVQCVQIIMDRDTGSVSASEGYWHERLFHGEIPAS
jgi:hypothetical protein